MAFSSTMKVSHTVHFGSLCLQQRLPLWAFWWGFSHLESLFFWYLSLSPEKLLFLPTKAHLLGCIFLFLWDPKSCSPPSLQRWTSYLTPASRLRIVVFSNPWSPKILHYQVPVFNLPLILSSSLAESCLVKKTQSNCQPSFLSFAHSLNLSLSKQSYSKVFTHLQPLKCRTDLTSKHGIFLVFLYLLIKSILSWNILTPSYC